MMLSAVAPHFTVEETGTGKLNKLPNYMVKVKNIMRIILLKYF